MKMCQENSCLRQARAASENGDDFRKCYFYGDAVAVLNQDAIFNQHPLLIKDGSKDPFISMF